MMTSLTNHPLSSCHDQRRRQQQKRHHRFLLFTTPISLNISLLLLPLLLFILISTSQSLLHPVTFTRRLTTLLPRGGGGDSSSSNGCDSSSSLYTSSSSTTPPPTTTTTTTTATTHTTPPKQPPPPTTTTTKILAVDSSFVKPRRDSRHYRAILLSNKLKVLLISDDNTDVEAGSVHVKAGHFNDPDDRAGLAHFHEHMLFLGTKKYPSEDEYETFLSSHGGASNAYTDMEDTNYYFSVAPLSHDDDDDDDDDEDSSSSSTTTSTTVSSALSGALDRLSQFFISPLFATDAVERELRAVDSEYVNGCSEENWRQFSLMKSSADSDHPFSKFGCGNYYTLTNGGTISTITNNKNNNNTSTDASSRSSSNGGSSPSPALRQFWEDNYHAENMQLCVVGRATLDDLQEVVERYFSDVRTLEKTEEAAVEAETSTNDDDDVDILTNGATATDSKTTNDNDDDVVFKTEHATYGVAAFGSDRLGMIRDYIPLTERRLIKIQFAMPPTIDPLMDQFHPHRVTSHLIGHESPHSLHHLLNNNGYINGLSSGVSIDTSDFSLFGITISLTPHGMMHRNEVLDLLFLWLSKIKNISKDEMALYHDELRRIGAMNFEWREMGDPVDLASSAADLLGRISNPEEILVKGSRMGEYNDKVVRAFLNRFVPENALITIYDGDMLTRDNDGDGVSAKGEEWMTEQWYGARYRQRKMTEEEVMRWTNPTKVVVTEDKEEILRLPKLNEFIPTDFSLACDNASPTTTTTSSLPIRLIDSPRLRLWHKMDTTYRVPKSRIKIQIISPGVYRTARSMTLNRLYQRVLADDLNSFVYDASLAGCYYRVSCTPTGYTISLSGYSEKLQHLLSTLTTRMLSLLSEMQMSSPPPDLQRRFQKARIELLRETKNFKSDAPYEVANYNGRIIMEEAAWVLDSYIEELEGGEEMTVGECGRVVLDCLTGRNRVEALCMGNIDTPTAHQIATVISSHFLTPSSLPLRPDESPLFRTLRLPSRRLTIHSSLTPPTAKEKNNAVEYTLQLPSDYHLGYEGIATLELLTYLGHNSAFSQLRTREQLGYIVSCRTRTTAGGGRGMSIIVQSSTFSPKEMEERIEAWIESYRKEISVNYTEERLTREALAIAAQLLERDVTLSEEVGRYWGEISASATEAGGRNEPKFDRVERLAEEFTSTTKDWRKLLLDFFDEYLVAGAEKRRVLSVRVYGVGDGEEEGGGWKEEWKREFEESKEREGVMVSHEQVLEMKTRCGSWPVMPYWAEG